MTKAVYFVFLLYFVSQISCNFVTSFFSSNGALYSYNYDSNNLTEVANLPFPIHYDFASITQTNDYINMAYIYITTDDNGVSSLVIFNIHTFVYTTVSLPESEYLSIANCDFDGKKTILLSRQGDIYTVGHVVGTTYTADGSFLITGNVCAKYLSGYGGEYGGFLVVNGIKTITYTFSSDGFITNKYQTPANIFTNDHFAETYEYLYYNTANGVAQLFYNPWDGTYLSGSGRIPNLITTGRTNVAGSSLTATIARDSNDEYYLIYNNNTLPLAYPSVVGLASAIIYPSL